MDTRYGYSINDIVKDGPCGRTKVYSEIKVGRLRVRKLGRRTIILPEDRKAWLESLPFKQEEA